MKSYVLNLMDYGAKGDGTTDDTHAFLGAIVALESAAASMPAAAITAIGNSNRRGRLKLIIPAGCFVISFPEVMMRSSYLTRTMGFAIEGAGAGVTQILYTSTATNQYLFNNNDAWMGLEISGIEFIATSANANFMRSYSTGGAQHYYFERCTWNGTWNYTFLLQGSNNNSEFTFIHCNWNGTLAKAMYVPATEPSTADQFLNYNFINCNFEVESGDFLDFQWGGNINVNGGSFIHISGAGTFFKLGNNAHAYGVQRFACRDVRFEHRTTTSKLIDCVWNDGSVTFTSCDTTPSTPYVAAATVNALFTSANQKMPAILFQGCMLMGRHEYKFNVNSWNSPHNVKYDTCEFSQAANAKDFILFTNVSGINAGGTPPINFENCRSQDADQTKTFFDCVLGSDKATRAVMMPHTISIKDAASNLPRLSGFEAFELPLNAVILNVKFFAPAGAVGSTAAANYLIQTTDGTPVTVASINSANASLGFGNSSDVYFLCDTDLRRRLRLVAGAATDTFNPKGYCLVTYIA